MSNSAIFAPLACFPPAVALASLVGLGGCGNGAFGNGTNTGTGIGTGFSETGGGETGGGETGGGETDGSPTGGPTGGSSTGSSTTGGSPTGSSATGGSPTGGGSTGGGSTGGGSTGGGSTGGGSTGGGSTGGGSTGGGGSSGGSTTPDGPLVDPNCIDGMFSEVLPDPTANISDLVAGYSSGAAEAFVLAILGRRYTTGREVSVRGSAGSFNCVDAFLSPSATASGIYRQLPTVVHECGHGTDFDIGGFSENAYFVNDSPLILTCTEGDTTDRGGQTFARSRIRDDEFQSTYPGDFYQSTYLDGDPDDGNFDGGDQGFNSVLEETLQYVNSIATAYAFTTELDTGGSSSHRDGILTFLWYVTRYLHMARLDYPSAYAHLRDGENGCWRRAILTIWGRAWLYLGVTENMGHLGINDAQIQGLVEHPELVGEIQRLRDAEGCPAPDVNAWPEQTWVPSAAPTLGPGGEALGTVPGPEQHAICSHGGWSPGELGTSR